MVAIARRTGVGDVVAREFQADFQTRPSTDEGSESEGSTVEAGDKRFAWSWSLLTRRTAGNGEAARERCSKRPEAESGTKIGIALVAPLERWVLLSLSDYARPTMPLKKHPPHSHAHSRSPSSSSLIVAAARHDAGHHHHPDPVLSPPTSLSSASSTESAFASDSSTLATPFESLCIEEDDSYPRLHGQQREFEAYDQAHYLAQELDAQPLKDSETCDPSEYAPERDTDASMSSPDGEWCVLFACDQRGPRELRECVF